MGVGNSGAEIALELARDRRVWLSGEPSAVQPFRPERLSGRILKFLYSVLSDTLLAIGRDAGHVVDHLAASRRTSGLSATFS